MYKLASLKYREALEKGGSGVDLQAISRQDIKSASARAGLGKRVDTTAPEVSNPQSDTETQLMQRYADAYQRVQDAPTTKERFLAMLEKDVSIGAGLDNENIFASPDIDMTDEEKEIQKEFTKRFSKGLGSPSETTSVEDFIASFEVSKPQETYKAYWDNKQWSIGFGTKAKNKNEVISHEEALSRLSEETTKAKEFVLKAQEKYGYDFTDNQVDALTSFTYNLGPTNLDKLTENGTRGIEEISDMILEYNRAEGKVQEGLVKRRQAEYDLFNEL